MRGSRSPAWRRGPAIYLDLKTGSVVRQRPQTLDQVAAVDLAVTVFDQRRLVQPYPAADGIEIGRRQPPGDQLR